MKKTKSLKGILPLLAAGFLLFAGCSGSNDPAPSTTGDGVVSLTMPEAFTKNAEDIFSQSGSVTIYKSGAVNTSVTIAVADAAAWPGAVFAWYVDGAQTGTADTITVAASDYTVGAHYLSLEVTMNNALWSKEIRVMVHAGSGE